MKNLLLTIGSLGLLTSGIAQITNDGATIFVQSGAIVYSQDYLTNQSSGTIDNSGDIYVEGDWTNNAGNTALINNSPGTVYLNGASNQIIGGNDETRFFNLELSGANTKTLDVNATVTDTLNLTDAELQTQINRLAFLNPDPASVLWTTGFVSTSQLGGYISRATNQATAYMFPVGNGNLASNYRAVTITPSGTSATEYAVALRQEDASLETGTSVAGLVASFPRTSKSDALGDLNPGFFHDVARVSGTEPANVDIYYFNSDFAGNSVANWNGAQSQWELVPFTTAAAATLPAIGSPDMLAASNAPISNFSNDLFILSTLNNEIIIPQFISPEIVDGYNDTWIIENIEQYPNNKVQIFNRYGVLVYEMDGYNNTWDGKANVQKGANVLIGNNTLPSGTYFFVLDLGVEDLDVHKGYIQIRN